MSKCEIYLFDEEPSHCWVKPSPVGSKRKLSVVSVYAAVLQTVCVWSIRCLCWFLNLVFPLHPVALQKAPLQTFEYGDIRVIVRHYLCAFWNYLNHCQLPRAPRPEQTSVDVKANASEFKRITQHISCALWYSRHVIGSCHHQDVNVLLAGNTTSKSKKN